MADPTPPDDDPEDDLDPSPDEPILEDPDDEPDDDPDPDPSPEPEDEPEPVEPEPEPAPRARGSEPSRAARRIQTLTEKVRRLEEERRQPPPQPAYDFAAEQRRRQAEEAAEEERVLLTGDPAAIARHYSEKSTREVRQQLGALAQQTADANDRAAFDRECDRNPMVARMRRDVERELETARRNGHHPTRDAIVNYLLGKKIRERAPGAQTRQQRRADGDRQRQRTRPGNSRGDTGGGAQGGGRRNDQNSHAARAKRLDESGML